MNIGRLHLCSYILTQGMQQSSRRIPFAERKEVAELLKKIQKTQEIQLSSRSWVSPVVVR